MTHELPRAKPVVLIFKETLLPISETFIKDQADHLDSFIPQYVGLGRETVSLPLPADTISLTSSSSGWAALRQKVYRRVGFASLFHHRVANAKANLIHAHFASGGRSALPLADNLQLPLIVSLHGSDVTLRINFRQRYAELWEKASAFLCVSQFIRQRAIEAGFPEEKTRILYTGIDPDVFLPPSKPKQRELVLFVGRLVEKKGCSFLLQAIADVKKNRPNVDLVVIGDGPLRGSLEKMAKELKVACRFLGAQPGTIVRQWLAEARVFCAPSITASDGDAEGFGMVFAEAQAMGTPVVSFHHGGIPEVVLHGQTGLLAPEGDSLALASHIQRMLEDQVFWQLCAASGIERIRALFNVKIQTKLLEQTYAEFCRPMALRQQVPNVRVLAGSTN